MTIYNHVPLDHHSKSFYSRVHTWKRTFPYFAITQNHPLLSYVKFGPTQPFGRGHAIPAHNGYTAWCFETQEARDKFVAQHKAIPVEVK